VRERAAHIAGCDKLNATNGVVSYSSKVRPLEVHVNARIACNVGYALRGVDHLVCVGAGVWDRLPGECVPGKPVYSAHARWPHGQRVTRRACMSPMDTFSRQAPS
jgi:hypothetical protein